MNLRDATRSRKEATPFREVDGQRASWRGRVVYLLMALILLSVVAALFLGYSALRRRLYLNNPFFVLQQIDDSQCPSQLKEAVQELLRRHGVWAGGSVTITSIDIGAIRRELLENPLIASASIQRILPGTIRINVRQHQPCAILSFNRQAFPDAKNLKIDQDGLVLPLEASADRDRLPLLKGLPAPEHFRVGQRTDDAGVLAFLKFQRECQLRRDGSLYDVTIAILETPKEQMTLYLQERGPFREGARIVMPMRDIPATLDRLHTVVKLRMEANQTISYFNATYERIPVRP